MSRCPFLSSIEEKVTCFKECAFYEYEAASDGCPFKKIKGEKRFNFKKILKLDFDKNEEDLFQDSFVKGYL